MYDYTELGYSWQDQCFYWSYMGFSFFIMLNALIAIIGNAYQRVVDSQGVLDRDPLFVRLQVLSHRMEHMAPAHVVRNVLEAWVGDALDAREKNAHSHAD